MMALEHAAFLEDLAEPVQIDGTAVQAIYAEPAEDARVGVVGQSGSEPQIMLPLSSLPARLNSRERQVTARGRTFVCREERASRTTGWVTLLLTESTP